MSDNIEIQGLEFQIQNDSTQAVAGLKELSRALNTLKTATTGSGKGLSDTASRMRELNNALKTINSGDVANKLNRISTAMSKLSTVKPPRAWGNQLAKLNAEISAIKWTDGDKLSTLADGLRNFSTLERSKLNSYINQLGKLSGVIEQLDKTDLDKFAKQMRELATAMTPFANEMMKVSSGFSAFPSKIQRLIASTDKYNRSVGVATTRTNAFGVALRTLDFATVIYAAKRIGDVMGSSLYAASEWDGIANRFGRAFGDSAEGNFEWIQRLNSEMGISVQEFTQYSSIFGTMLKGYGVAEADAAKMAMNYTELAYDIWAGYNDIYHNFEDAAIAVRSAIAGEVEPIRKAGFTIVDSQLKMTAANYGIAYSSQQASEELKSYLRYLTLAEQAGAQDLIGTFASEMNTAEGMARMLKQQLASLSQTFGQLLIPVLVKVLPWIQAFVAVMQQAIGALAKLFGVDLFPTNFSSGLTVGAGAAEDLKENLDGAAGAAKKLKSYTMGFDELNVIDPSNGGGGGGGVAGGAFDGAFDIDRLWDESILALVEKQVDAIIPKMKDLMGTVLAIGGGFLAWGIAKDLIAGLERVKVLVGGLQSMNLAVGGLALGAFLGDIAEMKRYIDDILNNGANFTNVVGLLSEFTGSIGDVLIMLGKTEIGGALKVMQGIGEIVSALSDIIENGADLDNALSVVRGLTNLAFGISILTGNIKAAGWSVALQGLTAVIRELSENWTAIKQGDWSGVDKVVLIIGAVQVLGGLVTGLGVFGNLAKKHNIGGAKDSLVDLGDAAISIDDTVKTKLSPSLTSLAKNLGMGLVVMGEVAVGAMMVAGTIAILGKELTAIGTAWDEVAGNGDTIITGITVGSLILGGVGLATYGLGTVGKSVAPNMAVGALVLGEIGIASGLYLAEIWGVGKALDEIGKAWEPVLTNSDTIVSGMVAGTGLLVAVGTASAALGAISIGSAGTIPLAVAVGAAVMAELGVACVALITELTVVSDTLNNELAPSLNELNTTLPSLSGNMSDFTDFMGEFAGQVQRYTESTGSIAWSKIVGSFQKLFTGNPMKSIAKDIKKSGEDASALAAELEVANPEIEYAVVLMTDYTALMKELQLLSKDGATTELETGIFQNLQACGEKLVTGFNRGMTNKLPEISSTVLSMKDTLVRDFTAMGNEVAGTWEGIMSRMTTATQGFTTNSLTAFTEFQSNSKSGMNTFTTEFPKKWEPMWNGLNSVVIVNWNAILRTLETGINRAVSAMNSVIESINSMSGVTGISVDRMNSVVIPAIPAMAKGGFVNEGQLFIANEAGAEMVGKVGNHTAVANNQMIVNGIAQGVYSAMIQAMSDSSGGASDINASFNLYIDGKQVAASVEKANKQRGVKIMNGGAY